MKIAYNFMVKKLKFSKNCFHMIDFHYFYSYILYVRCKLGATSVRSHYRDDRQYFVSKRCVSTVIDFC